MKFNDYLEECLKDDEFREYYLEECLEDDISEEEFEALILGFKKIAEDTKNEKLLIEVKKIMKEKNIQESKEQI